MVLDSGYFLSYFKVSCTIWLWYDFLYERGCIMGSDDAMTL